MNSLKRKFRFKSPSRHHPSSLDGDANQTTTSNGHLAATSFQCKIYLLHEKQEPLDIIINKNSLGSQMFDEISEQLGGLIEKDYFGLRFNDKDKHPQWFDLNRNAYKQLKHLDTIAAKFRVKHYPPNPVEDLRQGISRYLLYLQLRRDFQSGRLLCDPEESYQLGALVAQAEFGDYDNLENKEKYLSSDFKIICNQTAKAEEKIMKIHSELNGLTTAESETEFIRKASKLDTYGVLPFQVKDQKGNLLYIGLTHQGLVTFQGSRRTMLFRWNEIYRFAVDGKHFLMYIPTREDTPYQKKRVFVLGKQKKQIISFKCDTKSNAACLWKWAVDQQLFFSLNHSSEAKRIKSGTNLFKKSKTFIFSGRCQKEVLDESANLTDSLHTPFVRGSSLRREKSRGEDGDSGMSKFATFPRRIRDKVMPPDFTSEDEIVLSSCTQPTQASSQIQMVGDTINQSDGKVTQSTADQQIDNAEAAHNTVSVLVTREASFQKKSSYNLPIITISSSENELVKIFPSNEVKVEGKKTDSCSDDESDLPEDEVPLLLDIEADERNEDAEESLPDMRPNDNAEVGKCKIAVWEDFEELVVDEEERSERSSSCPIPTNADNIDSNLAFCSVNLHSDNDSMTFPFEWTKSFKTFSLNDTKVSENEEDPENYDIICQPSDNARGGSPLENEDSFTIKRRVTGLQNSGLPDGYGDNEVTENFNRREDTNKPPPDEEEEANISPVPLWKILLVVLLTVIILSLIGLVPFFEAHIHSGSILHHVRFHPHVEQFYRDYYQPARTAVVKYFK